MGRGSEQHAHLRLEGASDARLIAVAPPDQEIRVGERVGLRLRADRMHVFDEL
jgi:ABC-type sugar transport system ATPase subunit